MASRYERRLKKLVKAAGDDWEIVRAGSVEVGDWVIVGDEGPLEVLKIDRVPVEIPPKDGEPLMMNLGNQKAFLPTTITLMGRKRR